MTVSEIDVVNADDRSERRTCDHREHDEPVPAVAIYEGVVPPAGSIRYAACENHAPDDLPPIRYLDAGDGNARLVTDGGVSQPDRTTNHDGDRHYPEGASIVIAAQSDEAERYHFKSPLGSRISVTATSVEQARGIAADGYRGFAPEEFEYLPDATASGRGDPYDIEPTALADPPVEADRPVNEHDVWSLLHWPLKYRRRRDGPTKRMVECLLAEWDDPDSIPFHDHDALQQAHGIGPASAHRLVGAAYCQGLVDAAVRGGAT